MQSVARLTQELELLDSIHSFVSPTAESRRAVVSYWQKHVSPSADSRRAVVSYWRKHVSPSVDPRRAVVSY